MDISETVRDRGLVPKDYQYEMAYGLSNGHMTDATWPWKVKLVTPIRLERNISKTAGDRDSVPKDHQSEMTYGVSNGHVTYDVTWPKGAVRQYGQLS